MYVKVLQRSISARPIQTQRNEHRYDCGWCHDLVESSTVAPLSHMDTGSSPGCFTFDPATWQSTRDKPKSLDSCSHVGDRRSWLYTGSYKLFFQFHISKSDIPCRCRCGWLSSYSELGLSLEGLPSPESADQSPPARNSISSSPGSFRLCSAS